ncbi:hybrid sensor histidine kinase/response regulator [Marinobacter sp. SS13-12]|uniref:ATP-binding response regulator n=1 Tax=Marinobacter sp. SS13-12 TaxID=3050451 RepID=UPI002555614A|nr:hybrid sensor histidine kinase/response regulator [Marinobacter sp. SS13-12]MDK8462219.1 hybrid sensor histidine kinase/response regulator [Marinobacter sp. SS13-12]
MVFPSQSMSILVVEDMAAMRKMVRDSLRLMGLNNVLLAENGEQALSLLAANRVDLIISDSNMPKMNGMELLKIIRKTPAWRSIPFMMVTAESDRTLVSAAIEEGVTQFLIKPFTYSDLQNRVNKITSQIKPSGRAESTATAEESHETPNEAFGHDFGNATVMLVGDLTTDKAVAPILKRFHEIRSAISGDQAWEMVHDLAAPDLILMEVTLPDTTGYDFCYRLKNDPSTAAIPVIFLTAHATSKEITRGFKAGCVDYITKPADPMVLQARVATHIEIRHAKEDLRNHIDTLLENARLREDVERMTRHDIKSPLSAIISTADALLQNGPWAKHVAGALETMRDAGFDDLNMVNRTLDLYKMERGAYRFEPTSVDLVKLAKRVIREMRSEADQKQVRIALRPGSKCLCLGEESLCLSLLRNLLKNAVEASPPGDIVYIMLNKKAKINLMIHNKGTVPDNLRDTFFDKYTTANKAQGTGLGTYSAKLMTEVQGGKIRFMSNYKRGTVLHVALEPALSDQGKQQLVS